MSDLALTKGLPAAVETEKLVLGGILTDPGCFQRIPLSADDFSLESHRRIWRIMAELHDRGEDVDRITVAAELHKRGQLEAVGGITYLTTLDENLPVLVNLDAYVRIVHEKALLRQAALLANSFLQRCLTAQEAPAELLQEAERALRELGGRADTSGNLQSAAAIIEGLDLNELGSAPRNAVLTPWKRLNSFIAGFREGELIVLGARPSAGKTTAAIEIAFQAALAGQPVANFSLEMRRPALLVRAACNIAQVDNQKVRHGRMSLIERHEFLRALNDIREMPWHIDDRSTTFAAMAREVRRMQPRPRLMIVDHLHLMRSAGRAENRNNELSQITRDLKLFAKDLELTVLLLAQLSRASEKENRPPEMRDLRDSGGIEADADVVMFLHRKEEMQSGAMDKPPVPVDLLLNKQREGVSFMRVPLLLVGKFYKFIEVEDGE